MTDLDTDLDALPVSWMTNGYRIVKDGSER